MDVAYFCLMEKEKKKKKKQNWKVQIASPPLPRPRWGVLPEREIKHSGSVGALSFLERGFIESAAALYRERVNFKTKSRWQLSRIHI